MSCRSEGMMAGATVVSELVRYPGRRDANLMMICIRSHDLEMLGTEFTAASCTYPIPRRMCKAS